MTATMPPRDAARAIAERLHGAGHIAYFAGGCVRDELMGLEPVDYDIATSATPEAVTALFKGAKGVGEAFGVVLVRHGGVVVEVATFRADGPYSDGRRPDGVRYADEIEDAHRRDFSINGLFKDPVTGRVIDHVGGVPDIQARVLRAIGSPEERIKEDRLRMLRAARFAARFDLAIDPATERAIHVHAGELAGVSRERIGIEIRKILEHSSHRRGATLVESLALDAAVFLESHASSTLTALSAMQRGRSVGALLAAWRMDRQAAGAGGGDWTRALMLSNREEKDLDGVCALVEWMRDAFAAAAVSDRRLMLASPLTPAAVDATGARDAALAERVVAWMAPYLADPEGLAPGRWVVGGDLIAAGMRPGPSMGAVLDRVYRAQLEGAVTDRREALARALEWGQGPS